MIFSDLDGTLLDHQHYSFAYAKPALKELLRLKIPLILASSKTAVELVGIRRAMGFSHCPAIVENGAGVLPADDIDVSHLDKSEYDRLHGIIRAAPEELGAKFSGFADWSLEEISSKTGLPERLCWKAATRQFSEPGLWSGNIEALAEYKAWLAEHGVTVQQGGRFMTLSFGADKVQRMAQIIESYQTGPMAIKTLALGDAPNDVGMLEAAHRGVIVSNPTTAELPPMAGERRGTISRTRLAGPQGWNDAVLSYLERADLELARL